MVIVVKGTSARAWGRDAIRGYLEMCVSVSSCDCRSEVATERQAEDVEVRNHGFCNLIEVIEAKL